MKNVKTKNFSDIVSKISIQIAIYEVIKYMRGVCDRGMCDMRVYISRLVKILYKWQPYKPLVLVYLLYLFFVLYS